MANNDSPTLMLLSSADTEGAFERLRKAGRFFVDKTDQLAEIAGDMRKCAIFRPQGFGKSLLLSEME